MERTNLSHVLGSPDDNFIEYFVFVEPGTEDAVVAELCVELNAAAQCMAKDYLWQKEPFVLKPQTTDSQILHGLTHYGDTVEDEWFIVHVLIQLTIQFPQIIVRVIDQDGEFLLIEAADHLPKWAESDESCQQRVYIYQGKIQLVQDKQIPGKPKVISDPELEIVPISVSDAINIIRKDSQKTVASKDIQEAIATRIGVYPDKIIEHSHYANLMLPPKLATILKARPDFVSAAIRAFYNRDSIDLKSARLMRIVRPSDGLVKSRVRFTKTLYAMLSSQEFRPDTKSGWPIPLATAPDYKAHCAGAKLALGFEIILSRATNETVVVESSSMTSSAWLRYEEKLKGYNYYKGFLEGSRAYKELQERAKIFFQTNLKAGESDHPDDIILRDLHTLMQTVVVDLDALKNEEANLPVDDDESWLEISADYLESMLEAQFKTKISDQKLDQIPEKLKEFMSQISDFKGVEVASSSQNGGSASEASLDEEGLEPLDFRADDFVSALDKLLLELGKPDKDWQASDDEYFSDEDEHDMNLDEIKKLHTFAKDSKIHQLMNDMDQELASTEVGKTFTSKPSTSQQTQASSARVEELDEFDNDSPYKPVDIDMNALANILESYQSQEEASGPAVNLLSSVGFDITKAKK